MKPKGNLVVGQSGGPTAVINSSLAGVIQEAKKHDVEKIYGAVHGIVGVLNEVLLDLGKEDPSTIEGLRYTPSAALGSCRYKLKDEDYGKVIDTFTKYNIRYFFYIGGNDSMETAHRLSEIAKGKGYELSSIGIPKTIDNDLVRTDHCPGYGSVARWVAIATRDAGLDTEAIGIVDKVKVIETMGRDTGWITAATALAREGDKDAPHLIYLSERPFIKERFLEDVERIYKDLGYVVVTVCEGLKDGEGRTLVESKRGVDLDAFGHAQRGGVSEYLCALITRELGLKARADKPGTIQRVCASLASRTDREEAYLVGREAVRYAVEGNADLMITLERESSPQYKCIIGTANLEDVIGRVKPLPDEYISERGNDVTKSFIEYARPLIGDPLPTYVRLR
ncbi:MAG: Pyrophosphate--fructose 6-phosphate 1-phosphotransferase [Dehalococcoidia bacterium]|nr:Pyrophosphate--fructose 6-phosphate 1-phosphotransferase [Bacillota bacterium]